MKSCYLLVLFSAAPAVIAFNAARALISSNVACHGGAHCLVMSSTSNADNNQVSRRNALQYGAAAVFSTAAAATSPLLPALAGDEFTTTKSGLRYKVVTSGPGPKGQPGDLITIRFKGDCNGIVFDDLFSTAEPYFYRLGTSNLVPGLDEAVNMMTLGDRWVLEVPPKLGFGPKGKPAAPGRPRIPGDVILKFEVEIVGFPGKEEDLIDLYDIDEIGDIDPNKAFGK
mmetsp:Transcript_1144/g.1550  ORF Transcript_1144/g.1550 Transcript_1144/m.1550 type:complete len:227 (-) Transcript_1144:127-807(-)|eukprot:CAMPEP_0113941806 /NCGR_PEP_ID=MMETSP1339-20121228/7636_1 /TAXON_ID=94617 /ORGANISM="Fibrocapsa japonica" /LENGTH=226 /DNA_ID=CAMNT_0000946051 /DNA_START=82 /DNA_END=762 /DNA_ORIENTATION=+ /assembly_acc=CAM_ASM_000762